MVVILSRHGIGIHPVEKEKANEASGKDPRRCTGDEVLHPQFLGCQACATHFENMAKESMSLVGETVHRHAVAMVPHNHVNNRLAGALSEDPHSLRSSGRPQSCVPAAMGLRRAEGELGRQAAGEGPGGKRGAERRASEALAEPPQARRRRRRRRGMRRKGLKKSQQQKRRLEQRARGEAQGGKTSEPPPGRVPPGPAQAQHRGVEAQAPQEEIVDLDSFHYKAKALRAAAAGSSRDLQRKEEPQPGASLENGPGLGLGLQPVEPEDLLGQRNTLWKRILTGQYTGSEEEGALEMYAHSNKRRWMSFLSVGFSRLDISLCVLLYFLSSMCLLAMYIFFKNRLRLRRAKGLCLSQICLRAL
ncbi:unnamed protein product, partial [Coregonus sp. 'balchen']